jgi:hypothetical protein
MNRCTSSLNATIMNNSMSQLLGPILVTGDHAKMARDTGRQPELPMDETLLNLYRYWEHEIGKSK